MEDSKRNADVFTMDSLLKHFRHHSCCFLHPLLETLHHHPFCFFQQSIMIYFIMFIFQCFQLILSRMSRFPSPAVRTNWPFCVDLPLNNQSINHVACWYYFLLLIHCNGLFCVVSIYRCQRGTCRKWLDFSNLYCHWQCCPGMKKIKVGLSLHNILESVDESCLLIFTAVNLSFASTGWKNSTTTFCNTKLCSCVWKEAW